MTTRARFFLRACCFLSIVVSAVAVAGCGGETHGAGGGPGGSGSGSGSSTGGSSGSGTGTCVNVPPPTASQLSCGSDQDCTWVWSGNVCYNDCNCPNAPANMATSAAVQASLGNLLNGPEACGCPAPGEPRCVSNQCVLCPYDGTSPPGCGSGSGTSSSDAGVSGSGSGAAQCVQISLSSYDQSCNVASDCTVIETGNVCSGSCGCGDTFINVSGEAQYEQAVSGITFGDCFCPSVEPQCVNNQCVGAVP